MTSEAPTPNDVASMLMAFVDVLIPGDDLFPSASVAGTHGLVADKVRALKGGEALAALTEALTRDGVRLSAQLPNQRIESVRRFEETRPTEFAFVRNVTYYMYYQSPMVTAAIRALGHDYNDAPQPFGYPMGPFDPTLGVDLPSTPKGAYKRTDEVTRIDVSGLAVLHSSAGGGR